MDRLSESLLSSRLYSLRTHCVANASIIDVVFSVFFFISRRVFILIYIHTKKGDPKVSLFYPLCRASYSSPQTFLAGKPLVHVPKLRSGRKYSGQLRSPQKSTDFRGPRYVNCVADHTQHHKHTINRPS